MTTAESYLDASGYKLHKEGLRVFRFFVVYQRNVDGFAPLAVFEVEDARSFEVVLACTTVGRVGWRGEV